jgi:hypothetical protein
MAELVRAGDAPAATGEPVTFRGVCVCRPFFPPIFLLQAFG